MTADISSSIKPRTGGAEDTNQQAGSQNGQQASSTDAGLFRNWLRNALRGKPDNSWRETIEELIEDNGEAEAEAADHERMLLGNILRLKDLTAYDIMVPRADIVACDIETSVPDFMSLLIEHAHSRVPVYRDSLDDTVGFVHIKDVLAQLAKGGDFQLSELVRDVPIIAPSIPVLDLLLEMRQKRQHLALVIDEFGGIDGLITIEDLVEEIVGEIQDEHDMDVEPAIVEAPDGSYLADARYPLAEFESKVGPLVDDDDREDIDTLGGLVFSIAGRIPARGEVLRHESGLEFEVVEADPRHIKKLRVRPAEPDGSTGKSDP
ncbi:MAG: hemolysin family protein [Pseudomonadota bacterium]